MLYTYLHILLLHTHTYIYVYIYIYINIHTYARSSSSEKKDTFDLGFGTAPGFKKWRVPSKKICEVGAGESPAWPSFGMP